MAGIAVPSMRDDLRRVARLLPGQIAIVVFAVAGLGISIYLTLQHYVHVPLVCSESGLVDCSAVLTSQFSNVPRTTIPITLPGMLWFVVSATAAIATLMLAWRRVVVPARLFLFQKIWGGVGVLSILYLIYAEIVQLHHICIWCTGVHGLVLLTLLVTLGSNPVAATEAAFAPQKRATPKVTSGTNAPKTNGSTKPSTSANPAVKSTSGANAAVKPRPTTSQSAKPSVNATATKTATRPTGAKSATSGATRKSSVKAKAVAR